MDEIDNTVKYVGISFRKHTVPEVEDVALASSASKDVNGRCFNGFPRSKAARRIEVPLHRPARPDALACSVKRHSPVNADDICAGFTHQVQQLACPDAEMDTRDSEVGDTFEDAAASGHHETLVVGWGESACPAVE